MGQEVQVIQVGQEFQVGKMGTGWSCWMVCKSMGWWARRARWGE
jgi:hypothetical protein